MQKTIEQMEPRATEQDFPIVGVGASRGGLNAFKKFLKALPDNTGMAFVFVQHLDPDFESNLTSLLSKESNMPIQVIENDINLAPDNVYVIPSNKTLTAFDGVLKLTPREKVGTNTLIDVFFTSLAEVHQSLSVGIILTGTGSDGTSGLGAIKRLGGITFAQTTSSADSEGMPGNAIAAQVVDYILPIEEIPVKLIELFKKDDNIIGISEKHYQKTLTKIIHLVNQTYNIELTHYKKNTIQRRIARRIGLNNLNTIEEYYNILSDNIEELDSLYNDLLIPVTTFFRDHSAFEELKNNIIPLIFSKKESEKPIRVWSAGCSTGQEAYSIAMLIYEHQQSISVNRTVQIFATDVSRPSIINARKGKYTSDELAMLSEDRRKQFFVRKSENHFQIIKQLRDMCIFAEHNFLKDPPFSNIDLLICRNVLIYLEPYLQKKSLITFHYALNGKGFLFQGKSETVSPAPYLFSSFNAAEKIYIANPLEKKMYYFTNHKEAIKLKKQKPFTTPSGNNDFRQIAESVLLREYSPANVIINGQMEIVYINGDISPFLEPSQGKATLNLLKMSREGLAFELRSVFHKVKTLNEAVEKDNIQIKIKGKLFQAAIRIIPLENCMDPYYLVVFKHNEVKETLSSLNAEDSDLIKQYKDRIAYLELELTRTRENMQSITEDQETVSEELQSANEEMLSSNEELQSLNEELESSKEELINSNEELRILIDQLQQKNKEIETINKYTEIIMNTIHNPVLVIDSSFNIKSTNLSFYDYFDINNHIAGLSFFELKNYLFNIPKLKNAIRSFVQHRTSELETLEFDLEIANKKYITLQLNATKFSSPTNEHLILLSFSDITQQKIHEKSAKDFSEKLETTITEQKRSISLINKQLEQYAHTTNHEFQEPLRKLMTFSNTIKRYKNEGSIEKAIEFVGKLEHSATRMSKLISEMQNYASLKQHGKLFNKTDLNTILNNILFDFELVIVEKKAQIILRNKLPVITAISFQMNQLFYDLLSNALKFVKPEVAPLITISSNKLLKTALKKFPMLNPNLTYYQIDIEDNGIGFNQKYGLQLFTMFQRLSSANEYPGTGIGLAMCKKIVDDHYGYIYAEGIENTKAIFHVILPQNQPEKNRLKT